MKCRRERNDARKSREDVPGSVVVGRRPWVVVEEGVVQPGIVLDVFDEIEGFGSIGRQGAPGTSEDAAGGVDDEDFFRAGGRGAAETVIVMETF